MALGLIGKKIGMTRVFTEHGESRAVTVIEATPNRITQVKNDASDGYDAVQVTIGTRRATRVTQAMRGHFAKAGVEPGRGVWEFRLAQPAENQAGGELTVEMFSQGEMVDVTGRSIGKGFAGPMKRYGFRGGRATHGNSKAHRLGGSIGNAQDPGRVFKGKKMAGHMGAVQRVQQGLEVVRVDQARNLLLISGSIPGAKGADVIVQPSVKGKAPRTTPAPQKDVSEDVDNVSAKDSSKDSGKDSGKDSNKDSNKDASNVSDKHSAQDLNKDSSKDASKDSDKKSAKASNKDASKNAGNDANKSSNKKADK